MSAIDQRIVEMKFENHLFEKNAATSISTLQKLKDALNFGGAVKGLNEVENAAKNIDFSKIAASVDSIADRFSAMGIVGMTVIQNLTNSVMELGSRLASNILAPIKTGGWNRATNIDKAQFKIEGLKADWDALKEDINYGVQDTAYGFDEAANVASQLVASGIEAGDDMKAYLRSISGVAAMTSSTYTEIGHIFTTIAGEGKLGTERLNQFATRGLNVAAALAEQWGKTEKEVREMAHNGEISFDKFAKAMDEAYGDHAKDANETFEGAFANMKAALSRIGADFATPIRKNMYPVFNALKDRFKEMKTILEDTHIYEDFTDLTTKLSNVAQSVIKTFDLSWFRNITNWVHNAYVSFDSFMSRIAPWWGKLIENVDKTEEALEPVVETAENIEEIVNRIIAGDYGTGEDRFTKLKEEFGQFEKYQNAVNELLGCEFRYEEVQEDVAEATKEAAEAQKSQVNSVGKLTNGFESLKLELGAAVKLFQNMFSKGDKEFMIAELGEFVSGLIDGLGVLTDITRAFVLGAAVPLKNIIKNIITVGSMAVGTIGNLIKRFADFFDKSDMFSKIYKGVHTVFTWLSNVSGKLTSKVIGLLTAIRNGTFKLPQIFYDIRRIGSQAFGTLGNILTDVAKIFVSFKDNWGDFVASFKETNAFKRLSTLFGNIKKTVLDLKDKAINAILDRFKALKDFKLELPEIDVKAFAEGLGVKIDTILDKISEFKSNILTFLSTHGITKENFFNSISSLFEGVDLTTADGIVTVLTRIKERIIGVFNDLSTKIGPAIANLGNTIGSYFRGLGADIGGPVEAVTTVVAEFFESFEDGIYNFKLPTVKDIFDFVIKYYKMYSQFNLLRGLNGILDFSRGLGGAFVQIKQTIGALKWELRSLALEGLTQSLWNIAKSILAVSVAFKLLGTMDQDTLITAAIGIGAVVAALSILMVVTSGRKLNAPASAVESLTSVLNGFKYSLNQFMEKIGVAASVASIAAAIVLVGNTLIKITKLDWAGAKRALKIIAVIMLEFVITWRLIAKKLSNASFGSAATILALAYGISLLGELVKTLGTLKVDEAKQGVLALAAIGIIVRLMVSGLNDLKGATLPLMALIGVIGAMLGSLLLLSSGKFKPKNILNAAEALGIVMAAMAALMAAISLDKNMTLKQVGTVSVLMASIGVVVAGLALVLNQMKGLNGDDALKVALSLDSLLATIGLLMFSTRKLIDTGDGGFWKTVKIGGSVVAVITMWIGAITGIIWAFGKLNKNGDFKSTIDNGMAIINTVAEAMRKMVLLIFIISVTVKMLGSGDIGAGLAASTSALLALAEWVAGLTLLFSVLGGITYAIDWVVKFFGGGDNAVVNAINKFGEVLQALGNAIGLGVNGLVKGLFGVKSDFTIIDQVQGLLDIVDMFKPYGSGGEKAVDMSGVTSIADFFFAFAKTELAAGVAGFAEFFSGIFGSKENLDEMAGKLVDFAETMSSYSDKVKGINADIVTKTSAAIETVMAFANNVPNSGGLLGFIMGENDLDQFGKRLPQFAQGMVNYAFIIEQMKEEAVTRTDAAVKTVIALSRTIPNTGGLLGMIMGDNDMDAFGEKLEPFARAMVIYSRIISHFHSDAVTASADAITTIIDVSNRIPEMGGKLQDIFGGVDPALYGQTLAEFGEGLKAFSDGIAGSNFADNTDTINDIEKMLDIGNQINEQFNLGIDGQTIGSKITLLGSYVSEALKGINTLITDTEILDRTDDLQAVGPVLEAFGESIKKYDDKIKGINAKDLYDKNDYILDTISYLNKDGSIKTGWMQSVVDETDTFKSFGEVFRSLNAKLKSVKGEDLNSKVINLADTATHLSGKSEINTAFIDSFNNNKEAIINFATNIKSFSKEIKDFDEDAADKASKAIQLIKDFSMNEVYAGDVMQAVFGSAEKIDTSSRITDAQNLVEFAKIMVEFVGVMESITLDDSVETLEGIMEVMETDRFQKLFQNKDSGFGSVLNSFATALVQSFGTEEFASQTTGIGETLANTIVASFSSGETTLKTGSEDLVKFVADVFGSETTKKTIKDATSRFVDTAVTNLNTEIFQNEAIVGSQSSELIKEIVTSIENGETDTSGAIKTISEAMLAMGESYTSKYNTLGSDIVKGLIQGMQTEEPNAKAIASSILTSVFQSAKAAVKSSSPSKKFIELGKNNMMGLMIGMDKYSYLAEDSAENAGLNLVSTMDTALSGLSGSANDIVNNILTTISLAYMAISATLSDTSFQPVITPVLDLANVRNGVGDINGILSGGYNMPYLASLNGPSYSNEYTASNYNQAEIVQNIAELHDDMARLGQAITNLQIVMSTGEVVGSVTNGIDRSLGDIQKYNARWA